ncbi:MAG: alcohol dehydrogenase catalytic domain-containing protein [Pirellulaceae bacterium]|nr:alcohol dehydrogenase catalytic domain-containing protein [Pirellulaceae bacterium]
MKVLEWIGPREMRLIDIPKPEPTPGQILVHIDSVGVCGSELEAFTGVSTNRFPPLVLGHEFCGRVVSANQCQREWETGAPVAMYPMVPCFNCEFCLNGNSQVCHERKVFSVHLPGADAEYIAVDERIAYPIAEHLLGPAGAIVEPFSTSIQSVKHVCLTEPSSESMSPVNSLVVIGAGPIGLLAMVYAAYRGVSRIIAVDLVESRLDVACDLGATNSVCTRDLSPSDVGEAVRQLLGGELAESVIEAVGLQVTRQMAIASVAPLGRIGWLGLHSAVTAADFNHLIRQGITTYGTYAARPEDFQDAISSLEGGAVKHFDWIKPYSLADGAQAYAALVDTPDQLTKAVIRP